jgi:hypothetical protein
VKDADRFCCMYVYDLASADVAFDYIKNRGSNALYAVCLSTYHNGPKLQLSTNSKLRCIITGKVVCINLIYLNCCRVVSCN